MALSVGVSLSGFRETDGGVVTATLMTANTLFLGRRDPV